jgi:hypothetical protein
MLPALGIQRTLDVYDNYIACRYPCVATKKHRVTFYDTTLSDTTGTHMHTYAIYRHPAGTIVTFKTGWNWFAFFFSVAWLAYKQLWSHALRGAVALAGTYFLWKTTNSLEIALQNSTQSDVFTTILLVMMQIIVCVVVVATSLWLGIVVPYKSHQWRSQHLLHSGYQLVDTVKAHNSEGAHAVWLMQREVMPHQDTQS